MLGAHHAIRKLSRRRTSPFRAAEIVADDLRSFQVKDQYSGYLRKELTAQRDRHIADTRVHCCLFFINPTGHGLKPVSFDPDMFRLSDLIVDGPPIFSPLIAGCDSAAKVVGSGERGAGDCKVGFLDTGRAGLVQGKSKSIRLHGKLNL